MAINAAVPTAREGKLGQRMQVFGLKPDFLTQLPPQRCLRRFIPVDRAAEQTPMPGIEDARFQVAQLHEIAPVFKHDDGTGGMPRPQLNLRAKEIFRHRSGHERTVSPKHHRWRGNSVRSEAAIGALLATCTSMAPSVANSRRSTSHNRPPMRPSVRA